jgi:hypothetical protein
MIHAVEPGYAPCRVEVKKRDTTAADADKLYAVLYFEVNASTHHVEITMFWSMLTGFGLLELAFNAFFSHVKQLGSSVFVGLDALPSASGPWKKCLFREDKK